MFSLEKPLARRPFLAWGLGLLLLKIALDAAVAAAFRRPFALDFYVNPFWYLPGSRGAWSTFGDPQPETAYWLTVVGMSLPFLLAGMSLLIRRLRDAGLP